MLGKAFGAVAAMKQESFPGRHPVEKLGESARLAGKHQWRKGGKLLLDFAQRDRVRILRHLLNRLPAPSIRRPTLGHHLTPPRHRIPGSRLLHSSRHPLIRIFAAVQDLRALYTKAMPSRHRE